MSWKIFRMIAASEDRWKRDGWMNYKVACDGRNLSIAYSVKRNRFASSNDFDRLNKNENAELILRLIRTDARDAIIIDHMDDPIYDGI